MPAITIEEVGRALGQLLESRERAIAALALPDPNNASARFDPGPPRAPATPQDIRALEVILGRPLPPSFQHFLELRNGLPVADMGSDIFGTYEIIDFDRSESQPLRARVSEDIGRRDPASLVFFGASSGRRNLFIFDPTEVDEFGEWVVLYHTDEDGLLETYPNFLQFLLDLARTLDGIADDFAG